MRATLLHSPDAGYETCSQKELLATLGHAGYDAIYCTLDDDLDEVLDDPGDLVVVAGGDGTAERAARHLLGRSVPLGLLPLGTANNLCLQLGIDGTPEALIDRWGRSAPSPFDVGVAAGPWGETHFVETTGLGLFAELLPVVSAHKKANDLQFESARAEVEHDLGFLRDRLDTFHARTHHFTVDGERYEGRFLLVEVMNIGYVGPNLHLAPHADPQDGLLDVLTVREDERGQLEENMEALLRQEAPPHTFTVRQGRHVQLTWDGRPLHVDAVPWADVTCDLPKCRQPDVTPPAPVDLRVRPGALTILDGA